MAKASFVLLLSWMMACCISSYMAHASKQSQNNTYSSYNIPSYPRHSQKLMNVIDSCRRSNAFWDSNRKALADCAVGFGSGGATGGKYGAIYVVTDPSDDPVNPKPGTLCYGAIQAQPVWVIFGDDMTITLKNKLMVNSYKTIDGRCQLS